MRYNVSHKGHVLQMDTLFWPTLLRKSLAFPVCLSHYPSSPGILLGKHSSGRPDSSTLTLTCTLLQFRDDGLRRAVKGKRWAVVWGLLPGFAHTMDLISITNLNGANISTSHLLQTPNRDPRKLMELAGDHSCYLLDAAVGTAGILGIYL